MGTNITGIGNANAIGFKSRVTGGIYFPPELKDALVGVWSAYGKSNDSTDRNIIKNKIKDRGGDFVISNAAFKLNSGFGGFVEDFTSWDRIDSSTAEISNDGSKIKCINTTLNVQYLFNYINRDISSFKVKISNFTKGDITYYYRKEDGIEAFFKITPLSVVNSDKVIELPKSYNTVENGTGSRGGFYSSNINIGVTIEQIPSFEGAFVTDGIDDLITSTKTVQDMLRGSNEITVVSMAHFIKGESGAPKICRINQIRRETRSIRNSILEIGKSGIFGYTYKNGVTTINNILGDKNDCIAEGNLDGIVAPFSVEGYYYNNNSNPLELCSIAWYWTVIANKVLTTDQINQVIAYYNLDRCVEPTVLYDVKRQGLSNDTPDSDWYLKDFSKNGFDMSLFNFAKKGNSGVGKYETDFLDSSIWEYKTNSSVTSDKIVCNKAATHIMLLYYSITDGNKYDVPSFNVLKQGDASEYYYIDEQGIRRTFKLLDGINTLPASHGTLFTGTGATCGFGNPGIGNSVTITQIPSHAGALYLDGVNDFGQFVGDLGLKDYTLIMNRAYNNLINNQVPLISSNIVEDQTPFIVEHWNTGSNAISFSYGASRTTDIPLDINKKIVYQSTYSYMGYVIPKGNAISTGNGITLGKFGNGVQYSAICLWSLMLFPYSMSEFLIERQLKKHKLGTLYPNMVEFRPVIKANANYKITYYQIDSTNTWKSIKVGDYIVIGAKLAFQITFDNDASELKEVVSPQLSGIIVEKRPSNPGYNIYSYITSKSPQKINITIDEYIRYEDIVQPYPVLLRFNDENGNEVSWGGKFKVGSTITRIGSIADPERNLLNGLYSISGLSLNGKTVTSSTSIVEKQMVFRTTATWLLDDNEPKVILSPSRLRIPNSSYKILGYIPDISGHGNHGKINNSAYAGMSGVNGYVENFTTWGVYGGIILTDSTIKTNSDFKPANNWVAYKGANTRLNSFSVNITGIPKEGILSFRVNTDTYIELSNGRNDLSFDDILISVSSGFRITKGSNLDWSNLVIQQIREYEGSFCLDGVDDFITIPTTVGGKQVLMKVNWDSPNVSILYDQRGYNNEFAIYNSTNDSDGNPIPAYQGRNNGQTYIDGILNSNIKASKLKAITHNITITNELSSGANKTYPIIGSSKSNAFFVNMALYDFMLFDNISTDDKIKELNEYVGIEGNTE